MEDKHEEVLKQYEFKVYNTYRGRGALILDTNQGIKLYKNFEGNRNRLVFENQIKDFLIEQGYNQVDSIVSNKDGEYISKDSIGNEYMVKNWFLGEECNLRDMNNIAAASENLGLLHSLLKHVPYKPSTNYYETNNLLEVFEKHNRELKRVRGYIRDKKQKNEFEVCILNSFDEFYCQAEEATKMLKESTYVKQLEEHKQNKTTCHGNYTYHNVIFTKTGIASTNFDKAEIGIQVLDLYFFLRKAMEKNDWKLTVGDTILSEYNKYMPMSKETYKLLYVSALYPEKYWKITNFYYNNKKSWISLRNIQKLVGIREQSEQKKLFLEKLK